MATSSRPFEYHPEAVAEATAAYHWYAERRDKAADAFWDALRAARAAVTERPEAWASYLHGTRCLKLERSPYALVYVERGEPIVGIAVARLHRRPGYWQDRLMP